MGMDGAGKIVLVTGASSGIGAASARALAKAGFRLAIGARRTDRIQQVAREIEAETQQSVLFGELDVTSVKSCQVFMDEVLAHYGAIHVLLNNAGLAAGTSHMAQTEDETDWQRMVDTNIMGLARMTRLVVPHILASGGGHVINLGSIAGREAYPGGSMYCATKFAVRAMTDALRQELLGKPVRVTIIDPGMVETEFSLVRYHGDETAAAKVYEGMAPLTAEDIADCVLFAATRPPHVNIDAIIVKPLDQAGAGKVARTSSGG